MIPYARQNIDRDDINSVIKVLKSDWLTQGPKTFEFEKKLASYCGAKYAVAVSNGTAALHLSYLAAEFKKEDEIITTPNTFAATSNMLLAVGAKPVFCDIRFDTYNIDESKIEKLINKKTKAIVPVHFAGQACDMRAISKIAKRHKLKVIEDASHALGGKVYDKRIGDCRYSDMATFSFHAVKSIATGEGGAILTNSRNLYKKLISLRSHGIKKDRNGFNVMEMLGFNYRLTDIQAALGINQLRKVDKFVEARHKLTKIYFNELKNIKDIILPQELSENYSAWHIFVIRTVNKKDRLPLYSKLKREGIGVNFHYPAVYTYPFYQNLGYKQNFYPNASEYNETAITLPLFPGLTKKDIKFICKIIKDFL